MDRQIELIQIYEVICQQFQQGLSGLTERYSYNNKPKFTDEEVMAIYLFGIIQGLRTVTSIYAYIKAHYMLLLIRIYRFYESVCRNKRRIKLPEVFF